MVGKERLLGCGGDKLKVSRIQAKSRLCGVRLDSDEANSFLEFAVQKNV